MKILYSCLSKSWGGMEMFTLTAVKQLLKRNIKVELLCFAESRIHIEANNLGLIIHPVKAAGYIHPLGSLKLASIIRRGKFNLVHTQASKDLWLLVPALEIARSKIPLILTKQLGSYIIKKDILHRRIYSRVTFALAISEAVKKNFIETTPVPPAKVLLLHNGVNVESFNPSKAKREKIRDEFAIKDDELLIGMLARFSPGKGHEEFLYAAKELNEHYNNLKFIIVGEASRGEDVYAASIKKLAQEYQLKNIIFTGYRSDTADVLSAMDIFVFPSHSEAFGIALVEAMASGLPSVCSASEGVFDIAVENETSLFFKTKDGDDLAEKIKILINDPAKREEFSKNAIKRAAENFDLEELTDRALDIYRMAIKKAGV